ncbi:MAG: hypothetical protein ABI633_09620 [Burkholderiales bacterium]
MNGPSSAREALIAEALGEVGQLLDRVETLSSSLDAGRAGLVHASATLDQRLSVFDAGMTHFTQHAKATAVEHIVRRTNEVARQSIELQTRTMHEAARTAFGTELSPTMLQLRAAMQSLIERRQRYWELWLTHLAAAVTASTATWFLALRLMGG